LFTVQLRLRLSWLQSNLTSQILAPVAQRLWAGSHGLILQLEASEAGILLDPQFNKMYFSAKQNTA